jgi:hypothetical protein
MIASTINQWNGPKFSMTQSPSEYKRM